MKELMEAIYSRYTAAPANAFYTATSGRMEYGKARDTWSDNFAVYQAVTADDVSFFRAAADEVYWQINAFSTVRETCWDMLAAIRDLYDGAEMAVTDHYTVTIHKESIVPPIWDEESNLWQGTIEFRCMLQHS